MKKILLTIIMAICVCAASAQTISLYFPHFAGVEYVFYLYQGIDTDTIQRGTIGNDGNLTITIPDRYKTYVGMAQWSMLSGGGLSLAINGKDFSVSCTEAVPNENNITYSENPEIDFMLRRYQHQQNLMGKIELIRTAQAMYQTDSQNNFYQAVEEELKLLKESFRLFQLETQQSKLYAAHYFRINDFMNFMPLYSLSDTKEEHLLEMLRFVETELSMEKLFTSGLWKNTISQIAGLYQDNDGFVPAMITKLKQTTSLSVYEQLAEAMIIICEQQGWNEQEEQLSYFLVNDGRINKPTGKVKQVMTLYKLAKGNKAPALSQGKLPKSKTLLVFYETGCGNCEAQMREIKEKYLQLKEMGYEVVTVSADTDLSLFKYSSEDFPWKAKYCNGEGFSGKDFQTYGIIGTPTMFVIDKKGVIQGRYARLEDLLEVEN